MRIDMSRKFVIGAVCFLAWIGIVFALMLTSHHAVSDGCATYGPTHRVTIHNNKVSAQDVTGKRCDRLIITNDDAITREIAFGAHDDHVPYDGVTERALNKTQSLTVTLDKTGRYHWHDHLHDEVQGYFSVSN